MSRVHFLVLARGGGEDFEFAADGDFAAEDVSDGFSYQHSSEGEPRCTDNSLVALLLLERQTWTEVRFTPLVRPVRALVALQPLMAVRVDRVGSIDHLLAQEIQLPNADSAVVTTTAREPMSSPQEPRPEGEKTHDAERDGSVVEGGATDGVLGRQAEDDGDEDDPADGDDGDRDGEGLEGEGSTLEVARKDEGHGYGDAVGDIETNGGNGCGAAKSDVGAEGWEGEEEGAGGPEEDGTDGRVESAIDDMQTMRYAAVTGEGEHHTGVGGLQLLAPHSHHPSQPRSPTKLNRPQCHTQSMHITIRTSPPLVPQASVRI